MFKCKECKMEDKFELMISPLYKGEKSICVEYTKNKDIKITVDSYTFIPDLSFMNEYAVCSYCGSINCWDYKN